MKCVWTLTLASLATLALVGSIKAEPPGGDAEETTASRDQRLADYLTGATLVGTFTINGVGEKVHQEKYTINKCEVLPADNTFRITSHMKYLSVDQDFSIDLKILWSGNTPVITIDSMWIPGMGTIGARVLFHSGQYAGTWRHDQYTGHMFGKVEKATDDAKAK